ncbi:formyl transferase [Taklimakanibacter lacteus]|uniref:formyl transferase n=1 Tax=Taklimakanibacter lacteus TaxID=2268456 RepID=UPI0013C42F96
MARIVVLTVPSPQSWIIVNALVQRFGPVTILAEEREAKLDLIRKRMRRQGPVAVMGQIGFVLFQKLLGRRAQRRIDEIIAQYDIDPNPNLACEIMPVTSVNSMACRAALAMLKPDVVLVVGTRIIGRKTLDGITAPVVNFHSGINPKYRGQAGGYWALAMGDAANAGVTVHLVDEGVDTGAVLYQERFQATKADNFLTYFFIQAAVARPLAVKAVEDALAGRLKPLKVDLPSQQFYHPTLWFYLWTAWTKGVW